MYQIIDYPFPSDQHKQLIPIGIIPTIIEGYMINYIICLNKDAIDKGLKFNRPAYRPVVYVMESIYDTCKNNILCTLNARESLHYLKHARIMMPDTPYNEYCPEMYVISFDLLDNELSRMMKAAAEELYQENLRRYYGQRVFRKWAETAYHSASDPYNIVCRKRIQREFDADYALN